MNDYIALICARGGSKGLPGKNIRILNGKPLIAWAIEIALKISSLRRVIVSTDSKEIADVAHKYGAEIPFLRPETLAQDDSSEWLVWRHALNFIYEDEGKLPDGLVVLPVTAPLRIKEDVENCLFEFEKNKPDVVVTVTDAHRSPYFNMIEKDDSGLAKLVIQPKKKTIFRRQDAPIVYDMTTVAYISRPEFVLTHERIFDGKVKSIWIPPERAIDIDTYLDFEFAEFLLNKSSLS